jgi:PAS domain S-box-containing protein
VYLALSSDFGYQPAPIFFLLPIALSSYLGGLGPGLLSMGLSVLASDYFLASTDHTFRIENPVNLVRLTTLLVVGAIVSILLESLHRARRTLQPREQASATFALERNVRIGFAFGLLALVFMGGMSYRSVERLRADAEWVDHTHQVISLLRQLLLSLTEAETIHRGYMISGNEAFLQPYDAALGEVDNTLRQLRTATGDNPAQQKRLDALEPLIAARISYFKEVADLRRTQGPQAAQALIATGRGRELRENIHTIISNMEDLENAFLKERALRAEKSIATAKLIIVATGALSLISAMVGLFLLGQSFAGSRRAEAELREFAGQLESRVKERTAEVLLANASLRASEELQAVTLASIGDGLITTDSDGRVGFLNGEAERLTGWTVREARGGELAHVFRIVNEETRAVVKDPADRVLQSGKSVALANHTLLISRNGEETPIADCASPITDSNGNVRGVVLVFRDCTAQRVAEKALGERVALQEQLEKVAASAPVAICSFQRWPDGRSCFPYASQAFENIYGVPLEVLAKDGSPVFKMIHPEDAGRMQKSIAESAAKLTPWRHEFRIIGQDGGMKWVSGHSVPQRQDDGSVLWHGVVGDITERILAADARERLAAIVESSDDAIISKSLNGTITAWNRGAERIFGYSASEVIGKTIWLLVPENKKNEEYEILAHIANGESVEHFETTRIRKDGIVITVSATVSPIRDSAGAIVGASKIARDFTEKNLVESALKNSEERLRLAVDGARLGTWRWDLGTKEVTFSPRCKALFGLPPETEMSYEVFVTTLHAEDRARVQDAIQRTLDGHADYDAEYRVVWPDGTEHWIAARGLGYYDGAGHPLSMEGIAMDVTERRNAVERLLESEERFEAMANSIPQLAWMAEADGHIFWYNQRWYEYTGKTFEQMQGWGWQSIHDPEVLPVVLDKWKSSIASGDLFNMEFPMRGADGQFRMFLTKVRPLKDANGRVTRWFGTNTDITDLKKAQASQLSTQKLESLGTLSGGIAHDFNNILLAINGNAKLAISDLPPEHPARESLNEIVKAGARAAELVRRILAFSRPGEQKREVQRMQPVVEEAVKLVRATLPANIEIKANLPPNLPPVAVDPTQIHQVIVNLATNGAHAIGDRTGIIDLRLDTAEIGPDDTGRAPGLRPGRYVKLYVGDNGCGMDSATMARIYDPFFTTKPVGEGTGLGLSVVHGIVASHDGAVTVYSEPGKGTAFHLYFPAAKQPVAANVMEPQQIERSRNEHILYVDDEEALVFFAERMLTKLGYRVTGHTDAGKALEEFRAHPEGFDAVVTDMSMPRMSGLEFTREIVAIRADVLVVITSGYLRPEDQAKAEELGVRAVILKPTTADQLAKKLDQLLQERAAAGTVGAKSK